MPDWRGKVTYLQITPKSRSDIPEYAEMERMVERARRPHQRHLSARPTGRRSATSTAPTAAPRSPGSIASSRVGLVTPLRDGMNLVAKEYVAAQDPEDPGVLVLSRFAGAARECEAALLVNPYDTEAVAAAIARALAMPLEERRARHKALFEVLTQERHRSTGPSASSRRSTRPPRASNWPALDAVANG